MADPVRVFVSHHHSPEEDAFTARLVADLEAAGADVWVDTSGIPSGSFVAKISEGLEGRQWLVLVMTPASLGSPWVRREVEAALSEHTAGRMLGVVPFVMQPCREQDIPVLWRTLHRYDSTRDYQGAVGGLLRVFGLVVPARQPESLIPSVPPPTTSAPSSFPPDRFPPRLATLGYQAKVINGVEIILPPMCNVPAGEFLLGSDPSQDKASEDTEKPQHWVTLPEFQIARYPVTVAEYACFVRAGHAEPREVLSIGWKKQLAQRVDHPVVNIKWRDAVTYAAWLAKQTGQPWRLPSEAEWEKAARWDLATRTARIYPWGGRFDKSYANAARSVGKTTPVGSYASGSSPCGAQDMAGNVFEWTNTLQKPYPYTSSDWREAPNSIRVRVMRGGSWKDIAEHTRAAYRYGYSALGAGFSLDDVGFRVVLATPIQAV
jgi:formylglycine-generating enzyme required for sulfatase activity